MYIESEVLELQEKYSDTILRDIVAFLNSQGGEIFIGVSDNGKLIGVTIDKHEPHTQLLIAE